MESGIGKQSSPILSQRVTTGLATTTFHTRVVALISKNNNALGQIQDGLIMINNVVLATAATFTTGDVLQWAVDRPNNLLWVRRARAGVPQSWTGNGSADPASGVGGVNFSALGTGNIRPAAELGVTGTSLTSNFAAARLSGSIPTGFLALDQ
jgi:hypothetical protein